MTFIHLSQIAETLIIWSSKEFGFVEFADENEAKAAMAALNGKDVSGRTIMVNEARPQEDRRSGGGGGGGGGSFRRSY